MTKRAVRRARDIYLTHILLFALMLGGAVLLLARHPASTNIVPHHDLLHTPRPLATLLLVALLLVQPVRFDILPLYIPLILLVPLLVRSWRSRRAAWVLSLSAGLWFLSQPGVLPPPHLPAWVDLGFYSFFAWQFLFVCGLTLGCLHQSRPTSWWLAPSRMFSLVLTLFGLVFLLRHAHVILGKGLLDHWPQLWWLVDKPRLGPLRIFDFGLFVYLVAQVISRYGPPLQRTVVHRYLCFLGQHSLQVFAWSLLLWCTIPDFNQWLGIAISRGAQNALATLGVASLVIPAWLHAIYRERWRRPGAPPRPAPLQRAA